MRKVAKHFVCFLAVLLSPGRAEAQEAVPELRQVRWSLLEMVMVPDSTGLWFVAGPNMSQPSPVYPSGQPVSLAMQ